MFRKRDGVKKRRGRGRKDRGMRKEEDHTVNSEQDVESRGEKMTK